MIQRYAGLFSCGGIVPDETYIFWKDHQLNPINHIVNNSPPPPPFPIRQKIYAALNWKSKITDRIKEIRTCSDMNMNYKVVLNQKWVSVTNRHNFTNSKWIRGYWIALAMMMEIGGQKNIPICMYKLLGWVRESF